MDIIPDDWPEGTKIPDGWAVSLLNDDVVRQNIVAEEFNSGAGSVGEPAFAMPSFYSVSYWGDGQWVVVFFDSHVGDYTEEIGKYNSLAEACAAAPEDPS